ncbi:hypothetical protein D0Z07_6041 [Hyphodiscus hymeniophilus]|uniref:Myb-like DNA-binding domain-containing protein n=1 Tax=Hyphodiscus hymeniophilus TaxID=353542 RepID=A0A9P6VHQ7_9HELO|nr:hypothetical protein D0Z07_6041 [Hyphodiscus hymeniophilus]
MSQDTTAASAPIAAPTAKDGLFFLTILMNMSNKPEVDWDLVAAEAGFKNAKVASTRFGQMKKKFIGPSTPSTQSPNVSFSSTTTVPNTPRTPTGSPSKRVKKEVGSGTNVSSSGVRKIPGKGKETLSRGSTSKVRGLALEDAENEEEIVVRVQKKAGKYEEDGDEDFWIPDDEC